MQQIAPEVLNAQGSNLEQMTIAKAVELLANAATKRTSLSSRGKGTGAGKRASNPWKPDGFQAFRNERQKELKKLGQGPDFEEILANEWAALSKNDQQKFKQLERTKGPQQSEAKRLSGYNLFCKDRRKDLKDSGESAMMGQPEIMKKLAAEWTTQSAADKQRYQHKAKDYNAAQRDGLQREASIEGEGAAPAPAKRQNTQRALSGYQIYCREQRQTLAETGAASRMTQPEIMKSLAAEWRQQSAETKAQYKASAEQSGDSKGVGAEPKQRRAPNAYLNFCAQRRTSLRQEEPNLKPAEIMKVLGIEWSAFSPEEKNKFKS